MKEKIKQILFQHLFLIQNEDWYNPDEIAEDIAKILRQNNVSSNEANLKENKKDGEVAVCPTCNKVENVLCSNAWHILNERKNK